MTDNYSEWEHSVYDKGDGTVVEHVTFKRLALEMAILTVVGFTVLPAVVVGAVAYKIVDVATKRKRG